jgi:hypothetical protein
MPTVCWPRWKASRSSTPVANGARERGSVVRVTVTCTSGSWVTRVVSRAVESVRTGSWAHTGPVKASATNRTT